MLDESTLERRSSAGGSAPARSAFSEARGTAAADRLDAAIRSACRRLQSAQQPGGYWSFELEADCTITAEYILMMHFMDEVDEELQARLAAFLRGQQERDGGWPLYAGGPIDISCSVKAYYALKLAGDTADAAHMGRARAQILAQGGAARSNIFTRITLALFGQVPWRAAPVLPVEIVLLPAWFPFHLNKVSYWSRTVMVPLSVLCSLRAKAANPRGVGIRELFQEDPWRRTRYFEARSALKRAFLWLDRLARLIEPALAALTRKRALRVAEQWILERRNGDDGLGAIFPAMVNAYEALALLGYGPEHPYRREAGQALRRLVVARGDTAYCQPCVSPVWDTALACLALLEANRGQAQPETSRALDWLVARQCRDPRGDWQAARPALRGGGWPFQFRNDFYPDLDDTSVVALALLQANQPRHREALERAIEWIAGMQSRNGGYGAFDADNTHYYLNQIPFADHGALLDPPTSDVTARCAGLLAARRGQDASVRRSLEFLRREQEPEGCWFGRWGTNYIYGTWCVLTALRYLAVPHSDPMVRRAVHWLKGMQNPGGGWSESNDTYATGDKTAAQSRSTAFQTAWAMLGLMAAGEAHGVHAAAGAEYLLRTQEADGGWRGDEFTAPGFPRVFYLKYHGYYLYFPLWALAQWRNLACPPRGRPGSAS